MTAFCLCPKNLPEAEQKHLEPISLAKEISRQPDTLCPMVTSDHSYAGLRVSKAKRNTNCTVEREPQETLESRLVLKRGVMQSGGKEMIPAGQGPRESCNSRKEKGEGILCS